MPITLDGTNGITTPMYNGTITANAAWTPEVRQAYETFKATQRMTL